MEWAKSVGAGLACISLLGTGIGIGVIFAGLNIAVARNPAQAKEMFQNAVLGFALTEAIALFGLMIAFIILFA